MMRVAILDSGVTPDHPHIGNVLAGISISPAGTQCDYVDWIGHGTAVAAAIHEKAPAADLLIVKIFGRKLSANIDQLVMGIEWSLDQGASFINLSLGTVNQHHSERLLPSIQRANHAGSIIVSAREMNGLPCYPGSLPGVLAVGVDVSMARDQMRLSSQGALASPYPRPIPGVPPERNLHGVSFAVANVTGLLCAEACRQSIAQHTAQTL